MKQQNCLNTTALNCDCVWSAGAGILSWFCQAPRTKYEEKAGDELCQAQVSFAFHFVSFDKRKTM